MFQASLLLFWISPPLVEAAKLPRADFSSVNLDLEMPLTCGIQAIGDWCTVAPDIIQLLLADGAPTVGGGKTF